MTIDRAVRKAELGYWVGKPFWGRGYATEAAGSIVDFGFDQLGLNRITAGHMVRNPASGRVMQKIGMREEGLLKGHVRKWGQFYDVSFYGLVRSDYENQQIAIKKELVGIGEVPVPLQELALVRVPVRVLREQDPAGTDHDEGVTHLAGPAGVRERRRA